MRGTRFALRPGWIAFTLLCIVVIVTMVLLGRWQLDVSNRKHFSLQNFGYALQWWAFSIFTGVMWARVVRDRHRRTDGAGETGAIGSGSAQPAPDEVAYRRYVMSSAQAQQPATDPTLAAYNAYLAELARRDAGR